MGRIRGGRGREGKKKELLSLFFPREKIGRKKTSFFSLAKEKREGLQEKEKEKGKEKEKEKKLFMSPPHSCPPFASLSSLSFSRSVSLFFSPTSLARKNHAWRVARRPTRALGGASEVEHGGRHAQRRRDARGLAPGTGGVQAGPAALDLPPHGRGLRPAASAPAFHEPGRGGRRRRRR